MNVPAKVTWCLTSVTENQVQESALQCAVQRKKTPTRIGRPRSFCKQDALDKAMTVFWRQGYDGATMTDLTKAMGINPPSLYACFGSKGGLFRAVLERYDRRRKSFMEEVVAAPMVAQVAEAYLMGVAAFAADINGKDLPGCLMLQGGLSCGDATIPDILASHRAEKEAILRARFEQAKNEGGLTGSVDAATLARYLMVVSNGICVQAAAGATLMELREVAAIALTNWFTKAANYKVPMKPKKVSIVFASEQAAFGPG
jgi:AcrR family transcriptional regulator